jgi:aerobic carbon-monoxide dehydrogenase medium subunit
VKAPPFSYIRATCLDDVFQQWRSAGTDARLLAGGQTLLATLAFRLSEPNTLIDISRIDELRGITEHAEHVRVGALTTHAELGASDVVRRHLPLLVEAVPLIAHAAIRNRGTIGGSLAFADPAAELPACCVALDAAIIVRSATDQRRIPAAEFFTGLYTTALCPYELIASVDFPMAKSGERSTIIELARRTGDYAMAGIVAKAKLAGAALVDPRFVFFGVGEGPVTAARAMAVASGKQMTPETLATAQAVLDTDLDPPADQHASPGTKRHLARILLARAIARLAGPEEESTA